MPIQPDAILNIGGIRSEGHLDLYPGLNSRVRIIGENIGSLRATTRTTGALDSDYSLLGLDRAGVLKWTLGNNLAGDGADDFTLYRDADGIVADATAMKITRSTLRVDFYGEVYADGVQLGTGAYVALAGDTMTGALTIAATAGAGRAVIGAAMPAAITAIGAGPRSTEYPVQMVGYKCARLFMVSNIDGSSSQWSGHVHTGGLGMSNDGGIRMEQNRWYKNSDGTEDAFEPGRPKATFGMDSGGAISYSYTQPADFGADAYPSGQSFVINSAGGWGYGTDYVSDANVYIFTPQAGRNMWFGTSFSYGAPVRAIVINAADSGTLPGTIDLYGVTVIKEIAGGRHGWLIFGTGSNATGIVGAGTVYYDGTNFRGITAAGLKTFTVS